MKKISNKGITLIALVITIVVLLILAGISLNIILGENGLINKSKTAKNLTDEKSAMEKVSIEILGAIENNGEYNVDTAKENIEKNLKVSVKKYDEDDSLEFTYNSYNFKIDNEGKVISKNVVSGEPEQETLDLEITDGNLDVNKFEVYTPTNCRVEHWDGGFDLVCSYSGTWGIIYSKKPVNLKNIKKIKIHIGMGNDLEGLKGTYTLGLQKNLTKDKSFDENLSVSISSTSKELLYYDVELPIQNINDNYYLKMCHEHDTKHAAYTTTGYLYSLTFEY